MTKPDEDKPKLDPLVDTLKPETMDIGPLLLMNLKAGAISFVASIKKFLNLIKEIFIAADKKIEIKKEIESEEQAYQKAAEEIENNTYRKGIWAKAFAEAEGVEHRQKALYIKYRAKQLMEEDK